MKDWNTTRNLGHFSEWFRFNTSAILCQKLGKKKENNYSTCLQSILQVLSTHPKLTSNPPQMKTFGIMIKSSLESDLKTIALMLLIVEEGKFWGKISAPNS